jgi:hypothetical protein
MDKHTTKGTFDPKSTQSTGAGKESGDKDIRHATESAREKARQGAEQAKGKSRDAPNRSSTRPGNS